MTEKENGEFIRVMRGIGIVCGAMIAVGTIIQQVGNYWMTNATRDLVTSVERLQVAVAAGERRDSLIVEQVARLAEAQQYSLGSVRRDVALDKAMDATKAVRQP